MVKLCTVHKWNQLRSNNELMVMVLLHHRVFPHHPNILWIHWSIEFSKWIKQLQEDTPTTRQMLQTCQQQTLSQDEPTGCNYISQTLTTCQLHSIFNNSFRSTTSIASHVNMHEINWYITIPITKFTCSSHNILCMTVFLLTTCIPVLLHNNWSHGIPKPKSCHK